MQPLKQNPIIILDFGSQYTQLIGRRIREMGVYCEIHPYFADVSALAGREPCGIILSGGPSSVNGTNTPRAPEWVYQSQLPIFGICYGMQTMAAQMGGKIELSRQREFGYAQLQIAGSSALFDDNDKLLDVWMSHGDKVIELPMGFQIIGTTANAPIAAMADETRHYYGVQFHPEVTHTPEGMRMLKRFVLDICYAQPTWTSAHIIDEAIAKIKAQVGQEHVLLGLSGGVDSSVVAALLHQAIGQQLLCVFVDTGLLRANEVQQVVTMFGDNLGVQLVVVDAKARFFAALAGETCPERKRKIIGQTFVEVFEEQAAQRPAVQWLAQGTIYPDVIESAATNTHGTSEVIKSHHNVAGLPETMKLKLLEPLRELFKDEVRQVGVKLGLPHEMVYRHPFPGPGLGVRVLGEVKPEYVAILQQADAIFIDALHQANLYNTVSQAFAVFLPIKSVGVMGDGRRYDYVICLRAVTTIDFMTAEWARLPWDFLGQVSNRIINEVPGISRVTYDISGKPPATIEWE